MKKTIVAVTTVATVGISSAFFGASAHADPLDELQNQQSQIESERSDLKANLSEAEAKIADVLFELEELEEEIDLVDEALEHNQGKMDEAEEDITKTAEKVASLEEEISKLEEKIEKRYGILKERLVSYQQNGGDVNYLEVIFGSKSFGDFVNRVSAVNKITDSDAALVEEQEKDKQDVKDKQEEVLNKLEELEDKKSELDEMIVLIEDQKEQNEESKEELLTKQNDLETLKEDLQVEDSRLATLEDEVRENIAAENQPEPSSSQHVAGTSGPDDEGTDGSLTTLSSEESNSDNSNNNNNSPSTNSDETTPESSGSGMSTVINAGFDHLGVPYRTAGKTPSGFDCSGFVSWAFAQGGYSVPSYTGALANIGTKVSYSNAQPGDLVFFDTTGGPGTNGHVGIYLGGGKFIGSQSSTGLAVADMNSSYWSGTFNGHVRRVN